MSNDNDISNDELNDIITDEQGEDPMSENSDNNQEKSEQQEDETLELNEEPKKPVDSLSPQEFAAKKLEDSWTNKVLSGKSELQDVPEWLRHRVDKRLNSTVKADTLKDDLKRIVTEELEERQFVELQQTISKEKLPKKAIEDLKSYYAELRPLGKLKALKLAYKFVKLQPLYGVNNGTSLPPSGQPKKMKNNDILAIAKDEKAWQELVKNSK